MTPDQFVEANDFELRSLLNNSKSYNEVLIPLLALNGFGLGKIEPTCAKFNAPDETIHLAYFHKNYVTVRVQVFIPEISSDRMVVNDSLVNGDIDTGFHLFVTFETNGDYADAQFLDDLSVYQLTEMLTEAKVPLQ